MTKAGAFIKYGDKLVGQGREAARSHLKENPKLMKELLDAIWKAFKNGQVKEKVLGREDHD